MNLRKWQAKFVLAVIVAASCCFAVTKPLLPTDPLVSPDRIISVLAAANVPVRSAEAEFLTPIALNQPGTLLRLAHLERWQDDAALARIYCPRAGECLPFLVIVRWNDPRERDAALGVSPTKAVSDRNVHNQEPPKPLMVRAGHPATLLLQNEKMHIVTPIICLENGSQGQKIRVASLDRKRIVVAEVVEPGVLKGSL